MEKELIQKNNSEQSKVISASVERDADIIYLKCEGAKGDKTVLELDSVSANGLRIAIGSLQNIPKLTLPLNPQGDYQSHFLSVEYRKNNTLAFYKKDKETPPLGKYTDIKDGMIVFNKEDIMWIGFSVKNAIICEIRPKIFFTLVFQEKEVLGKLKKQLDREIFPFNRFGKINRLSYGYFHTVKEEEQ